MLKPKTLLLIELPPPWHGVTYINNIIFDIIKDNQNYILYNTKFSRRLDQIGNFSFFKILNNFFLIIKAWFNQIRPDVKQIYFSLSMTNWGILRDIIMVFPSIILLKKKFIHLHGSTMFHLYHRSDLFRFLFFLLKYQTRWIVLCDALKNKLIGQFSISEQHISVLPNCTLPSNKMSGHKSNDQNESEKFQILYLSNIAEKKGILKLLESMTYSKDLFLHIAGHFYSIEEKKKFDMFVSENNLSSQIKYYEFVNNEQKPELFHKCHIFVLPSLLEEGAPISIIEALSYGLPVIASDKGCITDMIKGSGITMNADFSGQDIYRAISKVRNSLYAYQKNAIKNYHENYTLNRFSENFINLFNQ